MEVYVVIERQCSCSFSIPQPGDSVAAYRQENKRHVQFESLCSTFRSCDTVAHHIKDITVTVLNELPNEQPSHYSNPHCKHPETFPVVLQIVVHRAANFSDWTSFPQTSKVLA